MTTDGMIRQVQLIVGVKTAPVLDDVKVTKLFFHHAQFECAESQDFLNTFQSKYFIYLSPFN